MWGKASHSLKLKLYVKLYSPQNLKIRTTYIHTYTCICIYIYKPFSKMNKYNMWYRLVVFIIGAHWKRKFLWKISVLKTLIGNEKANVSCRGSPSLHTLSVAGYLAHSPRRICHVLGKSLANPVKHFLIFYIVFSLMGYFLPKTSRYMAPFHHYLIWMSCQKHVSTPVCGQTWWQPTGNIWPVIAKVAL